MTDLQPADPAAGDDFIVYDQDRREYVQSIDNYDGDTDWTGNPAFARIFRGSTWADIWAGDNRRFLRPPGPPRTFNDLLMHLHLHPRVRITGPTPDSREPVCRTERFRKWEAGRLWFRPDDGPDHFMPIGCRLTDAEGGLAFDAAGFTFTKFGVDTRVVYLPDLPDLED